MTWVRSTRGRNTSMIFEPNSRFMKELAVIIPTKPGACLVPPLIASSKNRSVKGTPSEYFMWQVA